MDDLVLYQSLSFVLWTEWYGFMDELILHQRSVVGRDSHMNSSFIISFIHSLDQATGIHEWTHPPSIWWGCHRFMDELVLLQSLTHVLLFIDELMIHRLNEVGKSSRMNSFFTNLLCFVQVTLASILLKIPHDINCRKIYKEFVQWLS